MTSAMPSCSAMRCGGGFVVAGEHDDPDTHVSQGLHRGGGGVARCVGDTEDGGDGAVDGDAHDGAAHGGEVLPAVGERLEVDALAVHERPAADGDLGARRRWRSRPARGRSRIRWRPSWFASPSGRRRRRRTPRRWGARRSVRRRRRGSTVRSRLAVGERRSVTSGCPLVRVPVLSITTTSMRGRGLEGGGVLEQHPALGAETGADHDRRRGGEPEGVGAGDDDDGDGVEQRVVDADVAEDHPGGEGDELRRRGRRAPARTRPGRRGVGRGPWSSGLPGRA